VGSSKPQCTNLYVRRRSGSILWRRRIRNGAAPPTPQLIPTRSPPHRVRNSQLSCATLFRMSQVLFVCSGNTCRSPMAARIAQRVFGPTRIILSAGAETGSEAQAAKNAIAALKEIGLDLSTHSSVDVQDLDLGSFDLIVIFRPSSGEFLSISDSVPVAYLDVADPYGGTLDDYRAAARSIERGVRRLYTEDALRRTSAANGPSGSHLAGIFIRAANECEREVAEFTATNLRITVRKKGTLGQLEDAMSKFATHHDRADLLAISTALSEVNEVWKKVKHNPEDPPREAILTALRQTQNVYSLLAEIEEAREKRT
jgi:protein arginine phosphatase